MSLTRLLALALSVEDCAAAAVMVTALLALEKSSRSAPSPSSSRMLSVPQLSPKA